MKLPFTLQQLKILKAISTENNITKASKLLYLSQPSLTKHLKNLEKNLNTILINKKENNILLTDNGKLFLKYSERILTLCEESCRALNDLKSGNRGNLIIGASQTIGTYIMPKILTLFAQKYPQINLILKVASTRIISKNVKNCEIDLALIGGKIPYTFNKGLTIDYFIEDELILIIPKSHIFVKNNIRNINKNDLYHLNFITLTSTSSIKKFIDKTLLDNKIEIKQFNIIMQLNSIEALKTAVSLGLGAAFVSSSTIEKELELGTIEKIKINNLNITRTLAFITNARGYKSRPYTYFYEHLYELKNLI